MTLDQVLDVFLNIMLLPLQVVLLPIDALLAQIPGIAAIPQTLNSFTTFIGDIPETLVALTGINPLIWNMLITVFVLYLGLAPAIQGIKNVWAWVRP